jgi:hypothetical protein
MHIGVHGGHTSRVVSPACSYVDCDGCSH